MKTKSVLLTCLLLMFAAMLPALRVAAADEAAEAPPGVALAQAVATATGIAITPLCGVSAVGAWHYYKTPAAQRSGLPWYAAKWFWLSGLIVTFLLLAKDLVLGLVPAAKKPLDAIDVIENKASALVAAPAVVPMFQSTFAAVSSTLGGDATHQAQIVQAGMLPAWAPDVLAYGGGTLVVLLSFFTVWLAFHAINVLILLSPFGVLDTLLRSVKLLVLLAVVGAAFVHPYVGLVAALVVLALAVPIAGWSLRLTVFGGTLAWDCLSFAHRRSEVAERNQILAFTTDELDGLPPRSRGHLERDPGGGLRFHYRPWLMLPAQQIEIPDDGLLLGRGLLCPKVAYRVEGEEESLFRLAPRYRGHEETVARVLGDGGMEVCDMPLVRGLRAAWAWLAGMVGKTGAALARG